MKLVCWLVGVSALISCVESTKYSELGELSVSIPENFDIRNDSAAELPVTVVRGEGHTNAIPLEVVGLPTGLTADPAEIPAGESSGVITVRASGATIATEYPVIVNAVSQGVTATDTGNLYVLGKAGTLHVAFNTSLVPRSWLVGEIPTGEGFLFNNGSDYCLIDDRGRDVLTYADGGCIEPNFYTSPDIFIETYFASQRDQKMIAVTSYDDPQSLDDIDGLVFYRVMPDGKFDMTYGPRGNEERAFIQLPGFIARRIGISATNEVVVWAINGSGDKRLLRVSPQGVLLANRLLGPEGDLGVERADLIVEDDGKVVAAGSNQNKRFITRFNSDFTIDLYFGRDGVVNAGARVPHVNATADGYLAAGQLTTAPTIWRFDRRGQPSPGFDAAGISFPEFGNGFLASAFATNDRIIAAAAGTVNAGVLSLHLDGSRDRSFGLDGFMQLDYFEAGAQLLEMTPTSHSRASIGIRTPLTVSMVRYDVTRFWH